MYVKLLSKIFDENKRFILVGAINVGYMSDNSVRRRLDDLLNYCNSKNIVVFPTRECDTCGTSLDCGIVSSDDRFIPVPPLDTPLRDYRAQLYGLPVMQHNNANKFTSTYIRRAIY